MGDELDPYGLLEQAYDEAIGENIEDVSSDDSSSREGGHSESQANEQPFQQRSFIAHKDMGNINLEADDDNAEEDEDHEKLQFDFDVPSPAFEAISDEEGAVDTDTVRGQEEREVNRYNTPLNSTTHTHAVAPNLQQRSPSPDSVDNNDDAEGDTKSDSEHETSSTWIDGMRTLKGEANMESETSRPVSISSASDEVADAGVDETSKERSDMPHMDTAEFAFDSSVAPNEDEQEDNSPDDVDAPVPSPFSDIGDISGPESAMIRDILNETEGDIPEMAAEPSLEKEPPVGNDDDPATESLEQEDTSRTETQEEEPTRNEEMAVAADDSVDDEQNVQDVGGLIADIFGESDEEEEEFEGFADEELYPQRGKETEKVKSRAMISDDEDEDEADDSLATGKEETPGLVPDESSDEEVDDLKAGKGEMISDFDLMMQKKKEMNKSKRRGRQDFDIINDNDDIIAAMIKQMKDAAEEDRLLNQAGQAATKKLKMLPSVIAHLRKADLQHTFIDCGILPVIKEWLSPLPDNSLPHLHIRSSLLRVLSEFPPLDKGALKMSGVGRAVMLLFKHPKECRQNRKVAGKIIAEWARPIFGVTTKFSELSREDREERDKVTMPALKKRRLSSVDGEPAGARPIDQVLNEDTKARRPGDKGFVGRARVPMPSNRDYIVRPKSNVEVFDIGKTQKKSITRFDQQFRKYKDRLGALGQKGERAVGISLNGSKMSL